VKGNRELYGNGRGQKKVKGKYQWGDMERARDNADEEEAESR
jgi:hypothetical protein